MSGKSFFTKGSTTSSSSSEEISAFLGKETSFEGKMTFQGVFRLDGKFEGEIFESGHLIVGESAQIKGKIEVKTIVINGQVEGELVAKERVEIHSSGHFSGTLATSLLIIHEGGVINGYCRMGKESPVEKAHPLTLSATDRPLSIS